MEGTGDEVLLKTDFGLVDRRRHYLAMVAPMVAPELFGGYGSGFLKCKWGTGHTYP